MHGHAQSIPNATCHSPKKHRRHTRTRLPNTSACHAIPCPLPHGWLAVSSRLEATVCLFHPTSRICSVALEKPPPKQSSLFAPGESGPAIIGLIGLILSPHFSRLDTPAACVEYRVVRLVLYTVEPTQVRLQILRGRQLCSYKGRQGTKPDCMSTYAMPNLFRDGRLHWALAIETLQATSRTKHQVG